ncbi:MAG: cupredoxin domain-containing protein [Chloroflexota bacterium]|nr:cupredoxin domain-containing protein [Chloroflexota bacterium]
MALLISACAPGAKPASPTSTPTPRPLIVSSTSTAPTPTPIPGPADAVPAALTPFVPPTPSTSPSTAAQTSGGNQLRIGDFSFTPATITIGAGTKVTWTNAGPSNHTVTSNDGQFESGTIQRKGTFSFTFTKAGTYSYHCAFHPTMKGTIVVR